jgi:predicted alpha-1,2-mannosidase
MARGTRVQGVFSFDADIDTVHLKVGLSTANIEGAIRSLEEEITGWDFNAVRDRALKTWESQLQRVSVKGGNTDQKTIFYTAMYHALLAPALYSDLNGAYTGPDGHIHQISDHRRYTVFSLWDTFRAAHPLFTLILPEEVPGLVRSMLSFYHESGLLPVWELHGNETNTMIGYHSIPVLADAILKGFGGFDHEEAFRAMKKSAMQDGRGLKDYRERGYIPADHENESVSKALEYAYDDWCIAAVAEKLGHQEDHEVFTSRAGFYRNHFDAERQFMRGKLASGEWRTPFDPLYSRHRLDDYTEGNAWQYTWFVPHDVEGLIRLFGGREAFVLKLDSLFTLKEQVRGEQSSPDISGLIGQYAHGNEPSHHIAYLYNYAGQPWKTQAMIRKILDEMYRNDFDGLSGNEDCGQMSAWYILSAMGIYPVNPAEGIYSFGSPVFDEVTIHAGAPFRIVALNNGPENMYIQKATLNGQELDRCYIYHDEILKGGVLQFEMGAEPNTALWTNPDAAPPSMTQ